jgi:hypothetical protein
MMQSCTRELNANAFAPGWDAMRQHSQVKIESPLSGHFQCRDYYLSAALAAELLALSSVLISLANGSIFKMKPLLKSLSLRLLLAQSAVQSFHLSFQSTPFGVPSASEMSTHAHARPEFSSNIIAGEATISAGSNFPGW